ncbi:MAG: ATP-binding cassette domain-containing protein [Thermomicrobiales bacterium]
MQQQSSGPAATERDAVWGEYGRRLHFLARVGLFQGASPEVLTHVAAAMRPVAVAAGTIVCREGEPGDDFFLIETGTLAIVTNTSSEGRPIARLGAGEYFGELALLRQGHRTATVRAETDARLWALANHDFQELLTREPGIATIVRRGAQIREATTTQGMFEVERRNLAALTDAGKPIRIGRDPDNDLVFSSRLVSRYHAVVEPGPEGFRLRDLGSSNGTFVNGAEVKATILHDGDEIWVGDERFIFDRREILRSVEPRGIRIDVTNLTKKVKGNKILLHDITLSVLPGEFVAIVGGSGAGKTTLMDAISGVRPASGGRVLYNGRDYYRNLPLFRNVLGYVPQDDIIHTALPVRTTLRHAAKLRLPSDTSKADLDRAVDGALSSLSLTNQANIRVGALSGGQRKRASIGVELLTQPRIFFLDEPTSGLDPATDAQMMRLMRGLADDGSTVLLTTHATKNVMLCDKIIFLARGGYLAFVGTPQRALRYFEAEAFDEIYERLANEATPEEWANRFRVSPDFAQVMAEQPAAGAPPAGAAAPHALGEGNQTGNGPFRQLRQFFVLTKRTMDLYFQNPSTVAPLFAQPIIIALFKGGGFKLDSSNPNSAVQLLFLFAFTVYLLGLLYGFQEIVKELAIFRRERMVNLGIVPYVASKVVFFLPILVIGCCLMALILRVTGRLPASGFGVYGKLLVTASITALAGLAISLVLSAAVNTTDQAAQILAIFIMPQVLFSGSILAVPAMSLVGRGISAIMVCRWGFEAMGHITDLNTLFVNNTSQAGGSIGQALALQYGDSFSRNLLATWGIIVLFIVVPLILTCIILRQRTAVARS